jgi:hypothetical protein
MNELDEKLDILFLEIMNEETSPKKVKAMLDEMTLTTSEVGYVIVPFLDRLEKIGMGGLRLGNAPSFWFIGEIMGVFVDKYFNQVKDKGYYKTTRIEVSKNLFCIDCNKFFDVLENKKLNEIRCIHCNSPHWHHSKLLCKCLHDYALN